MPIEDTIPYDLIDGYFGIFRPKMSENLKKKKSVFVTILTLFHRNFGLNRVE